MRQMKKTEMPKTEMPVLELCQGSVSYPDGKQALKQVSAAFYPGEKVAVIGSNGAGKSTFFQTLNRITCLNEGELYCHGKLCTDKRKDILELRKCVGIVFQDPGTDRSSHLPWKEKSRLDCFHWGKAKRKSGS